MRVSRRRRRCLLHRICSIDKQWAQLVELAGWLAGGNSLAQAGAIKLGQSSAAHQTIPALHPCCKPLSLFL